MPLLPCVALCSFLGGVGGVVKFVALAVFLGVAFWGVAFFMGVVLIGDVDAIVALEVFICIALCSFLGVLPLS